MQALYSALVALGKSYEDARSGGWICGTILALDDYRGEVAGAPKCINGLVTFHLGEYPCYLTELEQASSNREAGKIAGAALIKTRPVELETEIFGENPTEAMKELLRNPDEAELLAIENTLISINDSPLMDAKTASAWFERAFDLLAVRLPDPIESEPLYNQQ